uniref:Uncharacterized protein n=1 Tax=Acrobeloides nanus TaxID=290746 RepID=A0A914CEL4_9BILA
METNVLKIILIIVMFVLTMVFGTLPIKVFHILDSKRRSILNSTNQRHIHWPSTVISILTCFAGGVFLGIIFLDLLSDALESFDDLKKKNVWNIKYPLVQLICLFGFFAVYAVDEFSSRIFTGSHVHTHPHHNQTLVTRHPELFDTSSTNGNTTSQYGTMGSQW